MRSGYRQSSSSTEDHVSAQATRWSSSPIEVRRYCANFTYQAQSWTKMRRVTAKVEWHPGALYPRIGFIVTTLSRPAERVIAFYNKRGMAEQWIKEGKNAVKWTRLSCCSFAANAVRLQLHALAYNFANFIRTLALPEAVKQWSMTSLKEKLIKIGAKVVRHGRYVIFQMAKVAVPKELTATKIDSSVAWGLGWSDASSRREECVRMTRKSTKSASREWSRPPPTPETVRASPYGFRTPQ
jgi:hypothetical protein